MQGYLGNEASSEWQFPNGVLQDYVMDFDSTSPGDYISAPMTMLNSATQCTISFWGKKDASNKILCIGDQITNSQGIWLMWYSDGNIYFSPRGTGGSNFGLTYAQPYDNNWHHYLAVYNGSSATNCKLYLDGDLVATGSGTAPSSLPAATGNAFKIGALISSSFYSDGQISNVAVWNTAITDANQIANIYNNGSPQTTYTVTPQNWWKLNADSVYTPSAPNYTTALNFIISSLNANTGAFAASDSDLEITISIWFKPLSTTSSRGIFQWASTLTDGAPFIIFQQSSTPSGSVRIYVDGAYHTKSVGSLTNNWHNAIITRTASDNTWRGYLDGNSTPWFTYNDGGSITNRAQGQSFYLGNGYNGYWNGELSNLAIWNTSLSSSQVSTLFNFGTPETAISFSPTAWWKLDNTTTGIQDSSGNGYNGTNNGATDISSGVAVVPSWKIPSALPITTTPNYTTALDFNSANTNYISFTNGSTMARQQNITYSAWVKFDSTSADQMILGNRINSTSGAAIFVQSNVLRFQMGDPVNFFNDSYYNNAVSNLSNYISSGEWGHIAATWDGTDAKMYINGIERNTWTPNQSVNNYTISGWGEFFIGRRSENTTFLMNGELSNLAFWNSGLTSTQIETIYNNGSPSDISSLNPVSWWKLDTGGSTITDYGSGGNNGTNNGATQVASDVLAPQPVNGVSTTLPSTALQQSDLQFDSPYSNYSLYI
jgi:hypothetical protein